MKRNVLFASLLVALLAGCMTPAPKAPTHWLITWEPPRGFAPQNVPMDYAVRLSHVEVRAPYNGQRLVVLRPDGTAAFDAYNGFAASPAALVKGATADAIDASRAFAKVIPANSAAATPYSMEVTVRCLALDCREPGHCDARVELVLTVIRDRAVVASGSGEGVIPVKDGNFTAAFSEALTAALREAGPKLRNRQ